MNVSKADEYLAEAEGTIRQWFAVTDKIEGILTLLYMAQKAGSLLMAETYAGAALAVWRELPGASDEATVVEEKIVKGLAELEYRRQRLGRFWAAQ